MNDNTLARLRVAALVLPMVNAVLFGAGLVTVLSAPALSANAFFWIPVVVLASFLLSIALTWEIAPMMMMRFAHRRRARDRQVRRPR